MHTITISGIEVSYHFMEGSPFNFQDGGEAPSVQITSTVINGQDAWDFVENHTDEDSEYEFSSVLGNIEELTLDHHLNHRR